MNLKSREGFLIGYSKGATHTPLEYLQSSNPKTAIFPQGFRLMLVETCPMACHEMKQGKKVYGFRTQDILEKNFNITTNNEKNV